MDLTIVIVIVIVVLVAGYYLRSKGSSPVNRFKGGSLRARAKSQLKLPPDQADQAIERQIERLKERYPNRSEEWYLEKIIYDYERDR